MNSGEREHKERVISVDLAHRAGPFFQYRTYARMRLQGRWLERAGFSAGTRVRIAVADGLLTISRAEG